MLKKIFLCPFIFFPLLTCIIFWPVSMHFFTFKNDALTYYYPIRTLISDALNNKELPLWTPFINMGYPLHGDMQSGAWNPVIWLFSFFTNYTLYGFHIEMLCYFSFAGIGFYFLCKEFQYSKYTALIMALAYECSGFMIDSVQFFVFISAACYLPYIFIFFKRLIHTQKIKDALLTSVFLFLLFTGSYPALFIITFYLLLTYLLFCFFSNEKKWLFVKKNTLPFLAVAVTFTLLCLPAIISFLQHLQYIERGNKQTLSFTQENSLVPVSLISLISPFSTVGITSWLCTDPLMRNSYLSITALIFIFYGLTNKSIFKEKIFRFFFFTALILFSLAAGSHFFLHKWAYHILPLINTFRHPAIFRLFGIFCLLIVAGYSLDNWIKNEDINKNKILKKLIAVLIIFILLLSIVLSVVFKNDINFSTLTSVNFSTINTFYVGLNFIQRFLIQLPFVLVILFLIMISISKKKAVQYLVLVCILDVFISTQFNIPATIIGAKKFAAVTAILNRNKERFPLPGNESINNNSLNSLNSISGSSLPFTKKIGRNIYYISPGNLRTQENFYSSDMVENVFKNRVLYFADTVKKNYQSKDLNPGGEAANNNSTRLITDKFTPSPTATSSINIIKLSANTMLCKVENYIPSTIIYLQNFYPGWKAFVDNNQIEIQPVNITFMAVKMPAGKHTLLFKYDPKYIKSAWYASLITMVFIAFFFMRLFAIRFFNKH